MRSVRPNCFLSFCPAPEGGQLGNCRLTSVRTVFLVCFRADGVGGNLIFFAGGREEGLAERNEPGRCKGERTYHRLLPMGPRMRSFVRSAPSRAPLPCSSVVPFRRCPFCQNGPPSRSHTFPYGPFLNEFQMSPPLLDLDA